MALRYLPDAVLTVVSQEAAAHAAAGRQASLEQLVAPFVASVSPDRARGALLDAVRGALAVAPEFEARRGELLLAAAGVADLIEVASRDRVKGDAWVIGERLMAQLDDVAAPLYEVARDLDPTSAVGGH
jgi:hypothetical protein